MLADYGPRGLSLVIPAWNEEARLPATLGMYLPFLEAYGMPVEIIVVADGVTDRTSEVAAEFESKGVRVLKFDHRLGKGGAVIEGFRSARYDLLGFIDADAPVTPVSVAYALSELAHADAAIASRRHPLSSAGRRPPFSRAVSSSVWNLLVRVLLGLKFRDTQCGAKFFRREAVLGVLSSVTLTNWAFDTALLFHLQQEGYKIVEVPVSWQSDPDTKLKLERVVPAMLISLIGIRLMSLPAASRFVRPWAAAFQKYFV